MLGWVLAVTTAWAGPGLQHELVWDVSLQGQVVGTRSLKVKYVEGELGTRRVLEAWTDLNGQLGPLRVRYRQRLTAHANAREPASFQSSIDENGSIREIQGRWTPSGWVVSVNADGRARTVEMPLNRVDLSTIDLFDPGATLTLAHFDNLRLLSAEGGEVLSGAVVDLGVSELTVGGTALQVTGYAWDSAQGRSTWYYSPDGFLVRYESQLAGVPMVALLQRPPPGGQDDFPVPLGGASVEVLPL